MVSANANSKQTAQADGNFRLAFTPVPSYLCYGICCRLNMAMIRGERLLRFGSAVC